MSSAQYNNELSRLSALVGLLLDKGSFETTITSLQGRVGELGTPTENDVIDGLNALKESIANSFNLNDYNKVISKFYYGIESSAFFDIGKLAATITTATTTDEKLAAITEYTNLFRTIAQSLIDKGIVDKDLSALVGDMSKWQEARFDRATEKSSDAIQELLELEKDLEATKDDEMAYRVTVDKIDKKLKQLNSTNNTLNRLRKKVGKIEPHQRSIKLRAEELATIRNRSVVEQVFSSEMLQEKLDNLRKAYQQQKKATSAHELYQAKKEIKRAEKELYGRKLSRRKTEKMDEALQRRREIIANANKKVDGNRDYRSEFKGTMKQLKKLDKKIIGRRNTKELYSNLRQKTGLLVGGAELTLPKQIVQLENSIVATRK